MQKLRNSYPNTRFLSIRFEALRGDGAKPGYRKQHKIETDADGAAESVGQNIPRIGGPEYDKRLVDFIAQAEKSRRQHRIAG